MSHPRDGAAEFAQWQADATAERTITIQQVADWIHQGYGQRPEKEEHSPIHSCACMHIARSLFGLNGIEYMYWPDGKGGNQWEGRAGGTDG